MAGEVVDLLSTVEPWSDGAQMTEDYGNRSGNYTVLPDGLPPASTGAVVTLSILFCVIGFLGLFGNFLVIWVVLTDRKMRNSTTNMFITNLAFADFLIMLFGIPEIIQVRKKAVIILYESFMRSRIQQNLLCKINVQQLSVM